MSRTLRIALLVAVGVGLLSLLTPWLLLSSWVPTQGKALLIAEVERRAPVRVAIGTMRYDWWRGLIVSDLDITARQTQQPLARLPELQARPSLSNLLRGRLVVRGQAMMERPCDALVSVAVTYGLRDRSLRASLATTDIAWTSITDPLKSLLPAPLAGKTLRLKLRIEQPASGRPHLLLEASGEELTWTEAAWRLSGRLAVRSTWVLPQAADAPWTVDGLATLTHARLEGVPVIGTVERLEGSARFTQEAVTLEAFTGRALGSPVTLEGTVTLGPRLSLDVLLTAEAGLQALAEALPTLQQDWQANGTARLRSVCRGTLRPAAWFDCLADADLRQAAFAGTKLAHPVTGMTGLLRYDALTHELAVEDVQGRLLEQPWTLAGRLRLTAVPQWALHVTGTLPVDLAIPWLPPDHTVTRLAGTAAVDVTVLGTSAAPEFDGQLQLQDAAFALSNPALTIEHLQGAVILSPGRLQIPEARLEVNGQPLRLSVTAEPLTPPHVDAVVAFAGGDLTLAGRLLPEELVMNEARLTLATTRLRASGRLSRRPERPSRFDLNGTVELSELAAVPFLPFTEPVEAWKLQGTTEIAAQFHGRLDDLPGAALQARLRSQRLSVRTIPLEQLLCTVAQGDRLLRIHVPSALLAGGKLWGEAVVKHLPAKQQEYAFQTDVVGLQIAQLAQAIPAWRARSATGTASLHAALSGIWQAKPTWKGEGWLNASGQQLGDVPLLDKLSRGLFKTLGDRLGLESLRRAHVTQLSFTCRLSQERIASEDVRLGGLAGAEPVAVYAKGSVGLDRTLDLIIEPQLSEQVVLEAPATSSLARTILQAADRMEQLRQLIGRHRVTGTFEKPEYRFEPDPTGLLQHLFDAVR